MTYTGAALCGMMALGLAKAAGPEKARKPAERYTANDVRIPASAFVITLAVDSPEDGQKALKGLGGVLDVVKAHGGDSGGSWVVAYYDPDKTDEDRLLKRLKEKGCSEAERGGFRLSQKEGIRISVMNSIVAPGDLVQLVVRLPWRSAKVDLALPPGWTRPEGASLEMGSAARLDIQTPRKAKPGQYKVTLKIKSGTNPAVEAQAGVELVQRSS